MRKARTRGAAAAVGTCISRSKRACACEANKNGCTLLAPSRRHNTTPLYAGRIHYHHIEAAGLLHSSCHTDITLRAHVTEEIMGMKMAIGIHMTIIPLGTIHNHTNTRSRTCSSISGTITAAPPIQTAYPATRIAERIITVASLTSEVQTT